MENGMIRWDMRIDAGGHEALFDELQARIWDYERLRWTALRAEYDASCQRQTYIIDTSAYGESNRHIIFSDKDALGAVHFKTFMSDCRELACDVEALHARAVAEIKRVHEFIAEQHAELICHFDPKITRLRKRKKILMHPRAFDDLNEIE
jgi:hypothetical protein